MKLKLTWNSEKLLTAHTKIKNLQIVFIKKLINYKKNVKENIFKKWFFHTKVDYLNSKMRGTLR